MYLHNMFRFQYIHCCMCMWSSQQYLRKLTARDRKYQCNIHLHLLTQEHIKLTSFYTLQLLYFSCLNLARWKFAETMATTQVTTTNQEFLLMFSFLNKSWLLTKCKISYIQWNYSHSTKPSSLTKANYIIQLCHRNDVGETQIAIFTNSSKLS